MALSGTAVAPAATPAAASSVDSSDLVNVPAGYPAQEKYPGNVDPAQYTDQGPAFPIEGPPLAAYPGAAQFGSSVPQETEGGGIQDTSWMTGTDGPQAPWDSMGGGPVTPNLSYPGAVLPELHGTDTGAVLQGEYVVPAYIGTIKRQTIIGQTMNREYVFDPVQGMYVPAPNGRTNMDQRQVWDPAPGDGGGYAPWDPGYAERPIYNNVAYEATQVNTIPSPYGVEGDLPDRSQWQAYDAQSYETPPDPVVNQPAAPAASTSDGWLLG